MNQKYLLNPAKVQHSFDISAACYDTFSGLQKTITDRLLESFDEIRIDPSAVLDLGSGAGYGAGKLTQRFKKAHIYQLDFSENMLKKARTGSRRFFSKDHFLCADANQIPIQDSVFDLVFSNLVLQWCGDLDVVFSGVKRLLKPRGLFIFSSLGPDTLHELRHSWQGVDNQVHVNAFIDMHDVGDALIRAGFDAPVLSTEHIRLNYTDCYQLMRELKGLGAQNINAGRRRTLTGKNRLERMIRNYETFRQNDKLPATYEVIYGHAWQSNKCRIVNDPQLQQIPLQQLNQALKGRKPD